MDNAEVSSDRMYKPKVPSQRTHTHGGRHCPCINRKKKKKLNSMSILTPWDWQQLVHQCSNKYYMHNMEGEDFKKFSELFSGNNSPFIYRKKNVGKEPILLSTCVHFPARQEDIGMLYLKSSFDIEFEKADLRRFRRQKVTFPTDLEVKSPVPISQKKFNNLMSLLPYVPSVCHEFYKNLEKNNNNNYDYPTQEVMTVILVKIKNC